MSLKNVSPVYETLKGWKTPTKNLTDFEDFPKEAKDFVSYIEEVCEVPIKIVSTGPDDLSTIVR